MAEEDEWVARAAGFQDVKVETGGGGAVDVVFYDFLGKREVW